MTTHTFTKKKVLVTQEFADCPNAIAKLEWIITFTDGTGESIGGGVTEFKLEDPANRFNAATITDAELEQYIIDEVIGSEWGKYVAFHEEIVAAATKEASLEVFYEAEA